MTTKLILLAEAANLGSAGDVVEVKDGYARNWLLPQNLAVKWSRGGQKQVDLIRAARAAREIADLAEAQTLAESLSKCKIKLYVRSGQSGRLFGSVKAEAVARAVTESGLGQIDKRKVVIAQPIRSLGDHRVSVKLHPEVTAELILQVIAQR